MLVIFPASFLGIVLRPLNTRAQFVSATVTEPAFLRYNRSRCIWRWFREKHKVI